MQEFRLLLLEDSLSDAELIQAALTQGGMRYELVLVRTRAEFLTALETDAFDLILSGYSLSDFDGISALEIARHRLPELPFIFVSATLGEELAIETLKNGATDYVLKQRLGRLVPSIQRALRETKERRERLIALRDRKRAEADRDHFFTILEQTNQTLQTLIESCPLAITFFDSQGIVKLWNQAAENIFGWSAEEVLGKFLPTVAHRRSEFLGNLQTVLSGQPLVGLEVQHRRKNGQPVDLDIWATLIIDAENHPGCLFIAADIGDRKQAEQALYENSARLKLLFETTSDLLSTEQPLTLMNGLFNKLAAQMELDCYFNYLVEERDNQQMLRLVSRDGIFEEAFEEMEWLEFGQGISGQVALERRQIVINSVPQSTFANAQALYNTGVTAYAGQPLIAQGRLLGVLSFASFTRTCFTPEEIALLQATSDQVAIALERAELTASLQRQKEQLTQANRIKDEFLAVLSHELRTPLNPILGWCRILRTNRCDEATKVRALEIIERNAKIQTQLIEDLLDVSRILQGKFSLNVCPVNLKQTIEAALETTRLAAEAKAIDLQFTIAEFESENVALIEHSESAILNRQSEDQISSGEATHSQPNVDKAGAIQTAKFLVLGDPNRLQQVVWNLVSNAVKFTATGGRVEVSLSSVIQDATHLEYAHIKVSDTGKGIDPNFLPHVFDYFRQADGSTTRTFGGLGLGLAIVSHLVQLHGGTVQAESPGEGQGATFTVRLPLINRTDRGELGAKDHSLSSHQSLLSRRQAKVLSTMLNGVQVLIVDDEKDTLDYIVFLLEQYGAIVTTATTATEALEMIKQRTLDVLISDIGMPKEDGYMLLRQVRSLTVEKSHIPAIALTAYARDEDRNRILAAGFQKHLSKPVEPSSLISTISELITPPL